VPSLIMHLLFSKIDFERVLMALALATKPLKSLEIGLGDETIHPS
jgi:hypothetical protein